MTANPHCRAVSSLASYPGPPRGEVELPKSNAAKLTFTRVAANGPGPPTRQPRWGGRGRPAGRGGVSRDKGFSPSTRLPAPRSWRVRGQDPPEVDFAMGSKHLVARYACHALRADSIT